MGYFAHGTPPPKADRVYTVSSDPRDYQTVQEAIDAAVTDGLSAINRAEISIRPGLYTTTSLITVPGNVTIKGTARGSVQLTNATTDLFQVQGPNVFFENFTIEGGTNGGTVALDLNNQNAVTVRGVDFTDNGSAALQQFISQSGTTWEVLFIEDCRVDFNAVSGFAVNLVNTAAAARSCKVMIDGYVGEGLQLTGFGGCIIATGVQDCRVRNTTLRVSAAAAAIGFYLSGGVTGTPNAELNHCWIDAAGSPGISIVNDSGTRIELYHTYYRRELASLSGEVIEDLTIDQFGIGTWVDTNASASDGDMAPNSASVAGTTQIVLYQNDLHGRRVRNVIDSLRNGDTITFTALDRPGSSVSFTVTGASQTATTATITGMVPIDQSGVPNWVDAGRWGLELIPMAAGDVVGPGSATDNALARYNGATGKIIQNSSASMGDGGDLYLSHASGAALAMQERAAAPAHTAGRGYYWVKNDTPARAGFTDDDNGDFYLDRQDKTIMARLDMGQTTNVWTTWLEYGPYAPSVWNSPVGGTSSAPAHTTAWAHSGIWFPREAKLWSIEIMLYLSGATTYNYDMYLRGSVISDSQTSVGTLNTHGSIIGSSYAGSAKRVLHTMTVIDSQILAGECLLFWHRRTTATAVGDDPEAMVRIEYSEVV